MPPESPRLTDKSTSPTPDEWGMSFLEEQRAPLSNEDRDFLLALLANPPKPNAALRKAAEEYRRRLDKRTPEPT